MEETFSDDNDGLQEKKQKRKVKTPYQIEALERLYDEHKYPAESLKLQLAESVGLTEKQVSGWFCHRRLKDKKLKDDTIAYGKQDRSSGVIQDRGSGLRQDSCGSTKQGEQRHSEPREVESRRFTGEEFSGAADITCEPENHYIQSHSGTDDTSSGSSSYLQDNYLPQSTDPRGVVTSVNIVGKGNSKLIDEKGSKFRTKPSGYLKVKAQAEHVAIASLKRQLGRHYQEDGPPLGIDFDPLPPGAFESPARDAVEERGFVGDPSMLHSSYSSRTDKQPHLGKGYKEYNSRMASHNSDLDEISFQVMHKSKSHENYFNLQSERKPTLFHRRNPVGKNYSSVEMNEDYVREAPLYGIWDNKEMNAKHHGRVNESESGGRIKESNSSHHLPTYGTNFTSRQREPIDYSDVSAKFTHKKAFDSLPSHFPVKHNNLHHLEERSLSRRATKSGVQESDTYGIRRQIDGYYDPVDFRANGTRPSKRSREDLTEQQHATKAAMTEVTPWMNPPRRSLAEVPSSFSEDETGETSSSAE